VMNLRGSFDCLMGSWKYPEDFLSGAQEVFKRLFSAGRAQ
jgi:hypothetical protein